MWFGGDTGESVVIDRIIHLTSPGYSSVDSETHTIDPTRPVCPAFAEIGERLGPFSLGLIPIGAYAPRHLMSMVHNAPIDAVRMFQDTASLSHLQTEGGS